MLGIDKDFRALLTSKEYLAADPSMRKTIMKAYQAASPEERQQFVYGDDQTEGLTLSPQLSAGQAALTAIKAVPDLAVPSPQAGVKTLQSEPIRDDAAMIIDQVGQVGGAAVLPFAPITGTVAGGYLANQANKALGLREGKPFGSPTSEDVLSGLPAVLRGAGNAAKATTKPAREALQFADDAKAQAIGKGNTALRTANLEAEKKTAANLAKEAEYKTAQEGFDTAVATHREALEEVPAAAKERIQVPDYRTDYTVAKEAAKDARPVDLTTPLPNSAPSFNDTAAQLGIDLTSPADALQKRGFVNLVGALGDWSGEAQPLQRVLNTQRKLGGVIGKLRHARGEEYGAAKELYASLADTLDTLATTGDDATKAAVHAWQAGNAGFRKQMAMDDYLTLFGVKKGYTNKPGVGVEVRTESILNNFDDLVTNNRFFRGSFSPEELTALRNNLNKLPTSSIPNRPARPEGAGEIVEPDYSTAMSPYSNDLVPDPGKFPYGRVIMAGMAGGNLGAAAMGQAGSNNALGWFARGVAALPYGVSKFMLATPERKQTLRNIMAGKQQLTPERLAAITAVAKRLGMPEDEAK